MRTTVCGGVLVFTALFSLVILTGAQAPTTACVDSAEVIFQEAKPWKNCDWLDGLLKRGKKQRWKRICKKKSVVLGSRMGKVNEFCPVTCQIDCETVDGPEGGGNGETSDDAPPAPVRNNNIDTNNPIIKKLMEISGDAILFDNTPPGNARKWIMADPDGLGLPATSPRLVQRYVLALFYYSTDGPNWRLRSEGDNMLWLDHPSMEKVDECKWNFITCDANGVVTHLFVALSRTGLDGRIPAAISRLTELQVLDIRNELLTGPIPTTLGTLSKLRSLQFNDNLLTGNIPFQLGNLPSLEDLELKGNNLVGKIPASLGNLENMRQQMWLYGNDLEGPVPLTICQLHDRIGGFDFRVGCDITDSCSCCSACQN